MIVVLKYRSRLKWTYIFSKISRFTLTLKLTSPKIPFKFVVVFKWLQYKINWHQEATMKMYIA